MGQKKNGPNESYTLSLGKINVLVFVCRENSFPQIPFAIVEAAYREFRAVTFNCLRIQLVLEDVHSRWFLPKTS